MLETQSLVKNSLAEHIRSTLTVMRLLVEETMADDNQKFKEEMIRLAVARLVQDGMEETKALRLAEEALNTESRFKLPSFEEL